MPQGEVQIMLLRSMWCHIQKPPIGGVAITAKNNCVSKTGNYGLYREKADSGQTKGYERERELLTILAPSSSIFTPSSPPSPSLFLTPFHENPKWHWLRYNYRSFVKDRSPPSRYELIVPSKLSGVMSQWHKELTDEMWYLFFSGFLSVAVTPIQKKG